MNGTRAAAWARAVSLLLAGLIPGCGEDAPRDRGAGPVPTPPDAGVAGADAAKPYDGTCSGQTCPKANWGNACCTRPGTGRKGHDLENVGRAAGLCGTDLDVIVPSLMGICLQIDQPGEANPVCPAQISIQGGDPRPGCCTDEGFCGSLDPVVPLGCFYATGLKGRRCSPQDGGPADGGAADNDAASP
jgi:hypothetical protein